MNRTSFFVAFLAFISFSNSFSQETKSDSSKKTIKPLEDRKHEIKIGVIKALAIPAFDLEYERSMGPYSSLGSNATINLNKDDYQYNFSVSPYFRFYFSKSQEYGFRGFFAQGFLGYYNGYTQDYYYDPTTLYYVENKQPYNALALGFGLGVKWANKAGFILQFTLGGGRVLVEDNSNSPSGVFQGDMYVGYRF